MSISLNIQFKQCTIGLPGNGDILGTVNHAMFYISSESDPTKRYRVHCKNGPNGKYHVESKPQKYISPRHLNGEGFEVTMSIDADKLTAAELVNMLSQFPAPEMHQGACQWWVLNSLIKLEQHGYVPEGTYMAVLADPRIDSSRLMEFRAIKDAWKFVLAAFGDGLSTKDVLNVAAQFPASELNKEDCEWWMNRIISKIEELGYSRIPSTSRPDVGLDSTALVEMTSALQATLALAQNSEKFDSFDKDMEKALMDTVMIARMNQMYPIFFGAKPSSQAYDGHETDNDISNDCYID